MGTHVIVGYGPVGAATADRLVRDGQHVRVVTRSAGPAPDGIERLALDATDAVALTRTTEGADALYNCANPPYHRWPTDWPPLASALLEAAESTGAGLVIMGNLYGYGPVAGPLTEDLPLATTGTKGRVRATMWEDALARHAAGRLRATEARASDFYGPGVVDNGHLGGRVVPSVLQGKGVHSFSYIPDVGRALARLGTDERSWGRPWHVPTAPAITPHQMVDGLADAAGVPRVKVARMPWAMVRAAGLVIPMMRELQESRYQFDEPFVLDSSAFTATFGDEATPLQDGFAATVAWWQDRLGAGVPGVAPGR
jgi:nucleoside-diphosphate-sugar epimerase